VGALLVNGAKSWLTAAFPTAWLFVLGALFVIVTLVLPGGVLQLLASPQRARSAAAELLRSLAARRARRSSPPVAMGNPEERRP
jgi:urea transport system permease protein